MDASDAQVPSAIRAFIETTNAGDEAAFLDVFTDDATLIDWGREFHGRDGVASWSSTDNIGVGAHFELVTIAPAREPDAWIVTSKVSSGRFNGTGPMTVTLRGDHIARLVISPD